MTSRLIGRADLLRALAETDSAWADETAALLGFERTAPKPPTRIISGDKDTTGSEPQTPLSISTGDLQPTLFWRADRFAVRQNAASVEPSRGPVSARPDPIDWDTERAVIYLLAPWRELLPRIRGVTAINVPTGDVDVDRVVEAWSQGRQRDPLPRVRQRRWPRELHVVVDRSDRLIPFWCDQDALVLRLKHLMPGRRLRLTRLDEAMDEPEFLDGSEGYAPPGAGGVVLALSDLGSLEGAGSAAAATWRALARRVAEAGCRTVALVPIPIGRCLADLVRLWNAIPWERGHALPQDQVSRRWRADRLFGLLSSCIRIEPGLLRAVRRCLPPGDADAGTEADVWSSRYIASRHPVAATPSQNALQRPPSLDQEDGALVERALRLRHAWRRDLPPEIAFLEIIGLPSAARQKLPPEEIAAAKRFFATLCEGPKAVSNDLRAVAAWLEDICDLATPYAWEVKAFRDAVGPVAMRDPSFVPPGSIDPRELPPGEVELLELRQRGQCLHVAPADSGTRDTGSPLSLIRSANGLVSISIAEEMARPGWADDFGYDAFGAWASIGIPGHVRFHSHDNQRDPAFCCGLLVAAGSLRSPGLLLSALRSTTLIALPL